jgi:Dolichyl-phosphate-mannose-protein mannosyltransferase
MQIPRLKSARLVDLLCAALLLSFAISVAAPRWRARMDWRDEGFLAYGAVSVAHGEIPQRDFVSLQPPLSFYTAAAVFKLCGTSLASLRIFGVALFLLLPLLIYGIARNFTGPLLSFAAAAPACVLGLPYFSFVPLAVWQGIVASFAAVFFFVPAALTKRQWPAFVAGVFTALSLFLRHDQAVYTVVSILVLVIALNFGGDDSISRTNLKRALLLWLGGMAVVSIPLIVLWWKIGALPEMFRQLVLFPFTTYRKTSSLPFPKFVVHRSVVDTAVILLFYIPLFVQAICALFLVYAVVRRRFGRREAILAFLVAWSALFYLQVLVRSDQTHLMITLPPLFLLSAFAWSILRETAAGYRKVAVALSLAFAALVGSYLWILTSIALPDVTRETAMLALPRGGVRIQDAQVVTDFVQRLQASVPPTRSILVLPYEPMFYFLCERRNPTRWNYLWPGDQTARDHERLIKEAERDPPAVVLLLQQRELEAYAPVIVEYVESHYIHTNDVGDIAIYVRPGTD